MWDVLASFWRLDISYLIGMNLERQGLRRERYARVWNPGREEQALSAAAGSGGQYNVVTTI